MFRLSGIFTIFLAIICGIVLFWTSQSVQRAEKRLSEVSNYSQNETESLRVLSAEWDYLNRPERLEALTKSNLDLDAKLADGQNFVESAHKIPEPVVPVIPKIKPVNLLRHISVKSKESVKKESIIEKNQTQNFDRLIETVSKGGQP